EKRKIQWIAGRYAVKSALLKYLIKSNRPDYITDLSYLDLRSSDKGPGIGPESEDIDNFDLRSFGLCNIELSNKYLRNIDILKGQDSAPYILQYNDINCSITHSYPFCIGVVSDKKIGIDIERIIPLRKSVIHYFYSEGEKGIIENCKSEDEYARKSISFWTRKEAVSKVLRLGMNMNFRELDTAEDTVYFHYLKNGVINISTFHSNAFCLSIAVER
ncbi:MAG: 4'-phosphopantetheinyl transferase family protein, partial [Halanaerobiales bacterium]